MDKDITIKGSSSKGLSFGDSSNKGTCVKGGGGMPVYVGAQAKVVRTPEGVKIWLKDYKGETEEIIAEAIEDIITNPDGSLLFVLPDGRTILTDSLKGEIGPQGTQGEPGPQGEAGPQGPQGVPGPTDYELMDNKPSINEVELDGNKTFEDLGDSPLTNIEIKAIFDRVFGE